MRGSCPEKHRSYRYYRKQSESVGGQSGWTGYDEQSLRSGGRTMTVSQKVPGRPKSCARRAYRNREVRLGVRVESRWMPRMVTEWLAPSLASCLKPFVGASSQISTAQHFGDNRNPNSYWPPHPSPETGSLGNQCRTSKCVSRRGHQGLGVLEHHPPYCPRTSYCPHVSQG